MAAAYSPRHSRAGLHSFPVNSRELAVIGELIDAEVYGAIVRLIPYSLVDQFLNELDHLRHVVCGSRIVFRPLDTQHIEVLEKGLFELCGKVVQRQPRLA